MVISIALLMEEDLNAIEYITWEQSAMISNTYCDHCASRRPTAAPRRAARWEEDRKEALYPISTAFSFISRLFPNDFYWTVDQLINDLITAALSRNWTFSAEFQKSMALVGLFHWLEQWLSLCVCCVSLCSL